MDFAQLMAAQPTIRWYLPSLRRYVQALRTDAAPADLPAEALELSIEQATWIMAEKDAGRVVWYENATFVSYSGGNLPAELKLRDLRAKRDRLLRESDFTQLDDVLLGLTLLKKLAWRDYRQALRDLPSTYVHGQPVVWPTKPE